MNYRYDPDELCLLVIEGDHNKLVRVIQEVPAFAGTHDNRVYTLMWVNEKDGYETGHARAHADCLRKLRMVIT